MPCVGTAYVMSLKERNFWNGNPSPILMVDHVEEKKSEIL